MKKVILKKKEFKCPTNCDLRKYYDKETNPDHEYWKCKERAEIETAALVYDEYHTCNECAIYNTCTSMWKKDWAIACDGFEYTPEMWAIHEAAQKHYPFNTSWHKELVAQGVRPDENGVYHKPDKKYELPKTALEARYRTLYIENDKLLPKEIEWVETQIRDAILLHKSNVYVDYISSVARERLEDKGYRITKRDENSYHSGFTVHWGL